MRPMNRRDWLKTTAGGASIAMGLGDYVSASDKPKKKLPVAAVVTTYGPNSHADVIIGAGAAAIERHTDRGEFLG